jgi:diguanylate cyclase (GGDEF)-like protein
MSVRARAPLAAARSAALILLVCEVAVIAWAVLEVDEVSAAATVACWSAGVFLLLAAAGFRLLPADRLDRAGAGALTALVGVALVSVLQVLTGDTSAGAYAFVMFPVLWAASHLHRGGVVLVTGAALAGVTATGLSLRPLAAALTDLVFFGAVLVVVASVVFRAAATQARLVTALHEQAKVDALTGLVNRRVFDEALLDAAGRAGSALVLIDVDEFKTINDVHGHPVGDEVLVHLAGVLREQVRSDDAVLSRLGGDELAVLLRGCSEETAARRAEALLGAVRAEPVTLPDGTRVPLSISVGVAHLPGGTDDLRSLYAAADAALYEAKRAGRGRVGRAP